jgi:outer membrane receptor for ferrienterochelin and colicins
VSVGPNVSPVHRLLSLAAILCVVAPANAQSLPHTSVLTVRVVDAETGEPSPGATVVVPGARPVGGRTDADGRLTLGPLPDGPHTVVATFLGYAEARIDLTLPLVDTLTIPLVPDDEELEETVVTATRTTRTIDDAPTRVETIGGEEIEEKVNMDPSGIVMVLNESPGIVVQQTSAVSASASFRIQGLDGRYTQLLRDGFPLYGGLSGGLSLLQTPPLDLAQVEVVKGPASTLYGGGAIAGLVNLVSKRPGDTPQRLVLVNVTAAGGLDVAGYASARTDRLGYTVLASANGQRAFDADGDVFTDLPATRRLTVNPTVYHYGLGTLTAGLSGTVESREGGAVAAVRDGAAGYTEANESGRLTAFAGYSRLVGGDTRLVVRSSGSAFGRSVETPGFRFAGRQLQTYTEGSVDLRRGAHEVVAGLDARTDGFAQTAGGADTLDYAHVSAGLFAQDTWDVGPALALETGLRLEALGRTDRSERLFVLPRASLLVRPGGGLTARVGGGLGYKAPTPFLEEAERRAYRGVRPVSPAVSDERSVGGTVDVNYRGAVGPVAVSLNQAVYLTRLNRPLVPVEVGDALAFRTADGHVRTAGAETTARLSASGVSLFLGYVFLDATRTERGLTTALPLTARHRTYTVLVWEQEGRGRVGVEAYYTGPQRLTGGERTPGYVLAGLMAERRFGPVRAFVNFENVLDARQSRTAPLVGGTAEAPTFAEVWGPTDGFVANGGVKVEI